MINMRKEPIKCTKEIINGIVERVKSIWAEVKCVKVALNA
jgi:hypothetical protein